MLATVGVPADRAGEFLVRLMDGVADAAAHGGATFWGGDLVQSEQVLVDVFVVGRVDRAVTRRGASPGDGVWVSGTLGGPGAAVRAWRSGSAPGRDARQRFAHPVPRIRESQWLRDRGARALIDLSDGLLGDAGHLAAASGAAIRLEAESVPVHPAAAGWMDAVASGEEYELLVALPPAFETSAAVDFAARFGIPLTRVGAVEAGSGVVLEHGGRAVTAPHGFSHF
jgi:thiamine-monophosphate kinase